MQKLSTEIARLSILINEKDISSDRLEPYFASLKARIGLALETTAQKDVPLFKLLNDILTWMPTRLAPTIQADLAVDIASYFYHAGFTNEAIRTLTYAEELACLSGDETVIYRTLCSMGVMLADKGSLTEAVEKYCGALQIGISLNDDQREARIWLNLGVVFVYSAEFETAFLCFNRVSDLARNDLALAPTRLSAITNISAICLETQNYAEGLTYARQAVEESPEPTSARQMLSRARREINLAHFLLEDQCLVEAQHHIEIAKHYAAISKSSRAEQEISVIDGLFLVYSGNTDAGLMQLKQLYEVAEQSSLLQHDLLIVLVKAYEFIGDYQSALCFRKEHATTKQKNRLPDTPSFRKIKAMLLNTNSLDTQPA